MARIFLSHSSGDELEAIALKQWLADNGWDDVFLDVDAERGLVAGERWQEALKRAADRCEAVLFLVSPAWAKSKWCLAEFLLAKSLNKRIFGIVLKEVAIGELPTEMTSEWQLCHLVGPGATETVPYVHREKPREVAFLAEGLRRLKAGLQAAGLGADFFPWPPKDDPERSPYRGLEPLDAADAAVFFGRDVEILRALDELRGMRASGGETLFVILGASGAGKSSFLRAGLLPRLARDERHFLPLQPVRPERNPLFGERGLARALHHANARLNLSPSTLGDVKAALMEGSERFVELLRNIQNATRPRLLGLPDEAPSPTIVLPVDQAEELFNADRRASPHEAREALAFLELVGSALRETSPNLATVDRAPMIVAFTIRSDRYEPLQAAAELSGLTSVVFDAIKPMPKAQFKEVITGPALRSTAAGRKLAFRPELVSRLLADCDQGADTLPLLGLTLARLFRDYGSGEEIRLDQYERMGGMADVIKAEAESVLAPDPQVRATQLELLHDAFIPALVGIHPQSNQPMRRVAALSDLPPTSWPLVQALVEKHLLLSDIRDGDQVVEVAHESLFRQWDVLDEWLREERADLKDVDRLEQAVAAWLNSGRKAAWLMEGERLEIAETLAAKPRYRRRLEGTREFLRASRQRDQQQREAEAQQREERVRAEQALRLAAEERQQAAEKLAATEARERAAAESAAARLKRQARILRAAIVGVAIALAAALIGFERAERERNNAQAALRTSTGLRLASESLAMLEGLRPGGSERALLQLIAARRIAAHVETDSALLAALLSNDMKRMWTVGAPVTAVAFSPDGGRIASGDKQGTLRFWDTRTGQGLGEAVKAHEGSVSSIVFTPDSGRMVSAGWDKTLRLWDGAGHPAGPPLQGHEGAVYKLAISPDGGRAVSGSWDNTLRLWDLGNGNPLGEPLRGHKQDVMSVAFSPDGARIASGSLDQTLRLWDAATGRSLGEPVDAHTAVVNVAFSPDGRYLVASGQTVELRDATSGRLLHTLEGSGPASSLAFNRDGTLLVAGTDKALRRWDMGGWREGTPLRGHLAPVWSVAFNPDGSTTVVSGSEDGTVRLWDADRRIPLGALTQGHEGLVWDVAFSPDGTRVASAGWDNTVRLWDARTGEPLLPPMTGHEERLFAVAFSPDGTRIVSAGWDKTIRLWGAKSGEAHLPPLRGHEDAVFAVAFSPDGSRIASGSRDTTIRLWDAETGAAIGTPIRHEDMVLTVAFSPDGKRIASGSQDGKLWLWDAVTGRPLRAPVAAHGGAVWSVEFSRDGKQIVSGSDDGTLRLWDAATGNPVGGPLTGHLDGVRSIALSPDGSRIASKSMDGTLRLWDARTGIPVGQPLENTNGEGIAYSPDGKRLVAAQGDSLWILPAPDAWPDELCSKLTRNMSRQEWRDWVSSAIEYVCPCPGLPVTPDDPASRAKPEVCAPPSRP